MNHWFLVGRDIMWFFISMSPLALANNAGNPSLNPNESAGSMFSAIIIQFVGIALLYFGVIR